MKVRCTYNRNLNGLLTTNKIYNVVEITEFWYIIESDVGILTSFLKDGFIDKVSKGEKPQRNAELRREQALRLLKKEKENDL